MQVIWLEYIESYKQLQLKNGEHACGRRILKKEAVPTELTKYS